MITIIPAIDLIDGKCVRLEQGDYRRKKLYNNNPLEVAKQFQVAGIERLHLVDLDGAKKGEVVNLKVLEDIAAKTSLLIDFGGGISSNESIQSVFNSGAAYAAVGSVAVKKPELLNAWVEQYGSDKILLGADVKKEKIAIGGWSENTSISIYDFLKEQLNKGIKKVFCTDIYRDGLLKGPSLALYQQLLRQFPDLYLIASGGVRDIEDIRTLAENRCSAVIIGKALYEKHINLKELQAFISRQTLASPPKN